MGISGNAGNAIDMKNAGIEFAINRKVKMRTRDMFIGGRRAASSQRFWALRNIDLGIGQGEAVGLIGRNGSGKSTMLKVIAGVLLPDEGSVEVGGAVAPLIELGAGFSPELSGRENVYLSGTILGLSTEEIDDRFQAIADFSEVGDFLDTPLKHYSSGMKVRLGFSIVIQLDHPIFLIDEVLAVGDKAFRKKCQVEMRALAESGRTLVVVSHRDADIQDFCSRAVYLKKGKIEDDGPVDAVLDHYTRDVEGPPA